MKRLCPLNNSQDLTETIKDLNQDERDSEETKQARETIEIEKDYYCSNKNTVEGYTEVIKGEIHRSAT